MGSGVRSGPRGPAFALHEHLRPSSLAPLQFARIAACDSRSSDVARDTAELLGRIESFATELGTDAPT
jgi:hypothetical protein